MPDVPNHLLTVWNPSYADDAMDGHLRVLLDWARRHREGDAEADEVHVWWAKIRSPNRQGPLPHADEVLALQEQILAGAETHLYLTDYRSLYVAHLEEVTDDDVPGEYRDERKNMPGYYEGRDIDFWFRLRDIRRLVGGDTPAVIQQLRTLRNTRYHDRPVSLYGGMVDLPLIVWSEEEPSWFADTDVLLDGRLWVEYEAGYRGESERMAGELRVAGGRVDLGGHVPHQTLGALKVLLEKEPILQKALRQGLDQADAKWLLGELPGEIRRLAALRNPAAHRKVMSRDEVIGIREQVLGIGQEGLLVRVAQARTRGD